MKIKSSDSHEKWKCADPQLERQIRCFPYGDRSDVPRLQQVEQKAIGRQRNLGLCIYVTQPVSPVKQELFTISVHPSSYLILVGFISFGCVVFNTISQQSLYFFFSKLYFLSFAQGQGFHITTLASSNFSFYKNKA